MPRRPPPLRSALAAVALLAALATTAGGAAAPPSGDSRAAPDDVRVGDALLGSRRTLADAAGPLFNVDVSGATTAPDDPSLAVAGAVPTGDSSCTAGGPGTGTVWFRLRGPDGEDLHERTAVTVDTAGSDYPNAVAVWADAPGSGPIVACERETMARGAAAATFVADAGRAYFVEVAGTQGRAGTLTLNARARDVQPPSIAVSSAQSSAEPGDRQRFEVFGGTAVDAGSGVDQASYRWSASLRRAGQAPLVVATGVGTRLDVRWPSGRSGTGAVRVEVRDAAGNPASASLQIAVRDRTPPVLLRPRVRIVAAQGLVAATARCSEPGRLLVALTHAGRVRARSLPVRRRARPAGTTLRRIGHGLFVLQLRCVDRSRNQSPIVPFFFSVP